MPQTKVVYLPGGWVAAVLLTLVFGIMCWVDTYEKFALVLSVFLVINIVFWQYLVKSFLPKTVRGLEKKYNKTEHYIELEQLRLVFRAYLSGSWQWARFVTGFVMIVFLMIAAYTTFGNTIGVLLGGFSRDLVLSLTTLLFVLVMEAWIWLYRFRVKMGLKLLKDLKMHYKLRLNNGNTKESQKHV